MLGFMDVPASGLWSEWEEQPIPALTPSIASPSSDGGGSVVRVRLGESLLRHSHEQKTRPEGRGRWVLVSGTQNLGFAV